MTRDQFIAEMMGKCWHEYPTGGEVMIPGPNNCKKCHAREGLRNPNFSTSPADILALQQFVMGAEWWGKFDLYCFRKWKAETKAWRFEGRSAYIKWLISDPNRFADLVAAYKGWWP